MLISTILTWMILILWFTGLPRFLKFRKVNSSQQQEAAVERRTLTRNVEKAILVKYQQLGKITLHEILVFVIFFVLVVLWVTQKIGTWGWYTLFTDKPNINYTHPAVPAALMCMLLFIIPKEAKYYKDIFNGGKRSFFVNTVTVHEFLITVVINRFGSWIKRPPSSVEVCNIYNIIFITQYYVIYGFNKKIHRFLSKRGRNEITLGPTHFDWYETVHFTLI